MALESKMVAKNWFQYSIYRKAKRFFCIIFLLLQLNFYRNIPFHKFKMAPECKMVPKPIFVIASTETSQHDLFLYVVFLDKLDMRYEIWGTGRHMDMYNSLLTARPNIKKYRGWLTPYSLTTSHNKTCAGSLILWINLTSSVAE
jgi:hypothetical protein